MTAKSRDVKSALDRPYRKALVQKCHIFTFRLHQLSMDEAYCYRRSSMVSRSVRMSVGLSVTDVNPAKTAEPIKTPFVI